MICRFTLAAVMATLTLAGCATQPKSEPSAPKESADTRFFKGPAQISANDFSEGPTEVKVSHVISRTDDGSPIYVTVDGNDAGAIIRGQSLELHLPAGEHQIGGYVPTLLGFGRVTVQSVKITTRPDQVKQVAYSVTRSKPAFTEKAALPVTKEKAAPAPEVAKTATAVSAPGTTTATPASPSEAAAVTNTTVTPVTAPTATTVNTTSTPATTSTTESATTTETKSTPATASTTGSATTAETKSEPATTSTTESATDSKTTSTPETATSSESASTEKATSAEAASTQG